MARLFVAAWPTADIAERLTRIDRPTEPGVRWVPRQNWHITLRFIGDADPDEVTDRLGTADLPGATAVLGPVIEPLGPRQIVVPVQGVDSLAVGVRSATAGHGTVDRRRFRGHITIARLEPNARSTAVGHPINAEFEIAEIALVASDLRPDGADYTTLAVFRTV